MKPREIVIGKAEGVNLTEAIQDAMQKAAPPSQGFDFQTYKIASQKIEQGGFVNAITTYVEVHVYDGSGEE